MINSVKTLLQRRHNENGNRTKQRKKSREIESREEKREESGEFGGVPSPLFIAKNQTWFGGYWSLPLACQPVDLRFFILISFLIYLLWFSVQLIKYRADARFSDVARELEMRKVFVGPTEGRCEDRRKNERSYHNFNSAIISNYTTKYFLSIFFIALNAELLWIALIVEMLWLDYIIICHNYDRYLVCTYIIIYIRCRIFKNFINHYFHEHLPGSNDNNINKLQKRMDYIICVIL